MWFKSQSKTIVGYTIYAAVGTVLEVVLLLVLLLWVPPIINIYIPWWIVVVLVLAELGVSFFTYIMGRRALSKKLTYGPEALVGSIGVVTTPFNPTGYIRVRGELWKASCKSKVEVGDEVRVTKMEGLKLVVLPTSDKKV